MAKKFSNLRRWARGTSPLGQALISVMSLRPLPNVLSSIPKNQLRTMRMYVQNTMKSGYPPKKTDESVPGAKFNLALIQIKLFR